MKINHTNPDQKKAVLFILIPNKLDFRSRKITELSGIKRDNT